jgi:hypothetical protein
MDMNFKEAKCVPDKSNGPALIAEFIKSNEIAVNKNNWAQNNYCF